MSNIPANNRPELASSPRPHPSPRPAAAPSLQIEVHSHLDGEAEPASPQSNSGSDDSDSGDPEPSGAGSSWRLPAIPADTLELLRTAAAAAALERGFRQGSIEIAVVDDPQIHELNRQFLQHDWETDVISFPYACEGEVLEGELIVSWETALRQAAGTNWPAATELALYVIHGTLHLAGMDDREAEDRRQMRIAEQRVLQSLGLPGAERYDVDSAERYDVDSAERYDVDSAERYDVDSAERDGVDSAERSP
ncbi:rRNA maturation RNase YbeY [Candidatus Laterigemmans baculatus]|uniref:rRNA maturation RNase YbeY n=1 Tax=Candidatus Laterigemmans baculatus TaxID=2770505 RepID=UPI0013D9DFEE|nr:rRNA maturation RNase YbeY [Candidatus Laterigemmans baculatus]